MDVPVVGGKAIYAVLVPIYLVHIIAFSVIAGVKHFSHCWSVAIKEELPSLLLGSSAHSF